MQADYSRRKFIRHISVNLGATFIGIEAAAMFNPVEQSKAVPQTSGTNIPRKLGIALVGLGKYAGGQLAPALKETQACYLAGIVTGSPEKAKSWKAQYNIPDSNIYNYNTFDTIKDNPDIDIVYVVLPNGMHSEYVIRAAKAGKHVICEKPMAITVEECDQMIAACKEAGKMLSIGYRLHFEPYNMHMKQLGQNKVYGAVKKIRADNGMGDAEGWRLDKKLAGGGPLMDVGIYCVQGARYTSGREPIAVTAKEGPKTNPTKFSSVEESLSWQMEFPDGMIAECNTSYSKEMNLLRADAEAGWFELSPAYPYSGQKGSTSDGPMSFAQVNQQARQMDDFAIAVSSDRPTPVPGEMGRRDVQILQAIYKAMETGQRVEI